MRFRLSFQSETELDFADSDSLKCFLSVLTPLNLYLAATQISWHIPVLQTTLSNTELSSRVTFILTYFTFVLKQSDCFLWSNMECMIETIECSLVYHSWMNRRAITRSCEWKVLIFRFALEIFEATPFYSKMYLYIFEATPFMESCHSTSFACQFACMDSKYNKFWIILGRIPKRKKSIV